MRTDQISAIARPYASAAFAEAQAGDTIAVWGALLDAAATVSNNPSVKQLLVRPGIAPEQLGQFYCDVLTAMLNPESVRFLKLLAAYRRLPALPEIAHQFQVLRETFEKKMTVKVVSAVPLDAAYQEKLSTVLAKRLLRQIDLECTVDAALIGGVVVRIGDRVLDGSVRGKLQRMIEYISGKSLG